MATELSAGVLTVLQVIADHGPISPHVICDKVSLSPRTVTLALSTLTEKKICRKVPNLIDMRKPLYVMDPKKGKEIFSKQGFDTVIRRPPGGMMMK